MLTDYLIDDFQQTYFVIDSFEQLFRAAYDTDFAPIYHKYRDMPGHRAERSTADRQIMSTAVAS